MQSLSLRNQILLNIQFLTRLLSANVDHSLVDDVHQNGGEVGYEEHGVHAGAEPHNHKELRFLSAIAQNSSFLGLIQRNILPIFDLELIDSIRSACFKLDHVYFRVKTVGSFNESSEVTNLGSKWKIMGNTAKSAHKIGFVDFLNL